MKKAGENCGVDASQMDVQGREPWYQLQQLPQRPAENPILSRLIARPVVIRRVDVLKSSDFRSEKQVPDNLPAKSPIPSRVDDFICMLPRRDMDVFERESTNDIVDIFGYQSEFT